MAGPTLAQRVNELTERVRVLEADLNTHKQLTDLKLKALQDQAADRAKGEDDLRNKVADLTAKNASLDERARHHEKTADRGWSIGQAAIVAMISIIGGALLSLLVQLAIKK